MSDSHAAAPSPAQVESAILELAGRCSDLVQVCSPGRSVQGRPIYAVTVTDARAGDDDKQHVLVLAGQHGEEESSRMIALALLSWLTSEEARPILQRQKIIVLPDVNPDGAQADTSVTAAGVNLNKDHAPTGATSPEAQCVEALAASFRPDAVVDMHCRGFAGCSYDMVLYPWTRPYTEDGRMLARLAEEMAAAGEAAGIAHVVHPLTWPGWWGDVPMDLEPHTLSFMYRHFKSLCILTETSESNACSAPAALRIAVGLARMRAFLEWGQRRHAGMYYSGYPVEVVSNLSVLGIAAVGATCAQRRRSRVAIWRHAAAFCELSMQRPEHAESKVFCCRYEGPDLPDGVSLQLRASGRWTSAQVRVNGRELPASTTDGVLLWQDHCSAFVRVHLPHLAPGTYEVQVRLA